MVRIEGANDVHGVHGGRPAPMADDRGGSLEEWGLLESDDNLHVPTSEDSWWTETVWFSWMVPERKILGYFYPAFRANLGVMFGNVLVTDASADLPWEIPFFEEFWHLKLPPDLDLRNDGKRDVAQVSRTWQSLRVRIPPAFAGDRSPL
jgi:hypothetical protein